MMLGSGSCIFTAVDDYQASLPSTLDLLALQDGQFRARLTWLELPHLYLLHARESLARIGYISLPPDRVSVFFPTLPASTLICDGETLQRGDIILYNGGERFHQRTVAATSWGSVSLTPTSLMSYGRVLTGRELVLPSAGRVLRLPPTYRTQLLRQHAQAVRIVETAPDHIAHPEVVRALEQDLIWWLVACLEASDLRDSSVAARRCADLLLQLEERLAPCAGRPPRVSDVCTALGISERMLRTCCLHLLGMGAARYLRLRWLRQVRRALLQADAPAVSGSEVANRYGFASLRQFARAYRRAFKAPLAGPPPHADC